MVLQPMQYTFISILIFIQPADNMIIERLIWAFVEFKVMFSHFYHISIIILFGTRRILLFHPNFTILSQLSIFKGS